MVLLITNYLLTPIPPEIPNLKNMNHLNKVPLLILTIVIFSCSQDKQKISNAEFESLDLLRGKIALCGDGTFGEVSMSLSCDPSVREDFNLALALLHSFEYDEAEKAMIGQGLSASMAGLLVEMDRNFNEGVITPEGSRSAENTTPTTMEDFAPTFAARSNCQRARLKQRAPPARNPRPSV